MNKLKELEDKAKRKFKGERIWCEKCEAYKYCSQVEAYGKPSGGNARYHLFLNDCPHDTYGIMRDFQVLKETDENYESIMEQTNPFSV